MIKLRNLLDKVLLPDFKLFKQLELVSIYTYIYFRGYSQFKIYREIFYLFVTVISMNPNNPIKITTEESLLITLF